MYYRDTNGYIFFFNPTVTNFENPNREVEYQNDYIICMFVNDYIHNVF